MCEIQFVVSNTLGNDNVNNFINMLECGSRSNRDATGIFSNAYQWKVGKAYHELKQNKDNSLRHILADLPSNWLVGHNRLATQGSETNNDNNHPFSNDTCTVVHNGIISNDDELKATFGFDYTAETDSAIVPALVDHYIRTGVSEIDAIVSSAEELQGSYSLFIYVHQTQNLYYLKNSSTNFYMMKTIDDAGNVSIYGSTSESSLKDMSYIKSDGLFGSDLFKAREISEPTSGDIYQIVYKGDNIDVATVGEFTPKSYVYRGGYTGSNGVTYYGKYAYEYDWDSLDDVDVEIESNNSAKRRERAESQERMATLMEEVDENIDGILESVVDDIENFGFYGEDLSYAGELTKAVMDSVSSYSNRHQQVVIRGLPDTYGDMLVSWLGASQWVTPSDDENHSNYTIKYESLCDYIEDNQ